MKIYVSSTFEDLKAFRRAVYDQLRKLRIDAVAMEDYVAVLDHAWRAIGVHRLRGNIPQLSGNGRVDACQAVSLLAIRQALEEQLG